MRDLEIEMAEFRVSLLNTKEIVLQSRADNVSAFRDVDAKISKLATKDDVAAIQTSIAKKEDWWKNSLIGPCLVGACLAGFELWLKHTP